MNLSAWYERARQSIGNVVFTATMSMTAIIDITITITTVAGATIGNMMIINSTNSMPV